jgi:hypothetical protein
MLVLKGVEKRARTTREEVSLERYVPMQNQSLVALFYLHFRRVPGADIARKVVGCPKHFSHANCSKK